MPPASAGAQARQHLLDLLAPVVERAGYDLDDLTVTSAGRRSVVKVIVDADGGVDLDAVAEVSRLVSAALDDAGDGFSRGGVLAGAYTLEVTSPGVDRPLTEARHWRRAQGRLVATEIGGRPVTGRVTRAGDSAVVLDVEGSAREVAYADLGRGRVQVEFNRPTDHTGGN